MRQMGAIVFLVLGCGQASSDDLILEGPVQLSVGSLGPVEAPRAVVDGAAPEGVLWESSSAAVAEVTADGTVRAVGPGEASIVARWKGQEVSWTLTVEPSVRLRLVDPPAKVRVAETVQLGLEAFVAGERVTPGKVNWSSSSSEVASVDAAGAVTGVRAGVAYVTVSGSRGEAMAEIVVVD